MEKLFKGYKDTIKVNEKNYSPRQAVFLYKKKKTVEIDICMIISNWVHEWGNFFFFALGGLVPKCSLYQNN